MSPGRAPWPLALLVSSLLCFGCRSEVDQDAEVVIFIDADEALTSQLGKIVAEVRDESGTVLADGAEFVLDQPPKLPLSFGVYQPPKGAGWFMLRTRGLDRTGQLLVEDKTIARFVARKTTRLEITLASLCSGKFCEGQADQTCNASTGQCEAVMRLTPVVPVVEMEAGPIREENDAGHAGAVTGSDAGEAGSAQPLDGGTGSAANEAGAAREAGMEAGSSTPTLDASQRDGGSDGASEAAVSEASTGEAEAGTPAGQTLPPTSNYAAYGPFATTMNTNTGPNNAYTIFRPITLGEQGFVHSPIVFGPGILTSPSTYMALLSQLASHGFVVICVNSLSGGPGDAGNLSAMRDGLDWLISQNAQAGFLQGKLATNRAVAMGYSIGATAAVQLSSHAAVITTVAIHGHNTSGDPRGPALLMTGSNDVIGDVRMTLGTLAEAPAIMVALPIGHIDVLSELESGGRYIAPITGWLRYWVNGDQTAKRYFWGASCDMCSSPWLMPESNAPWRAQSL